MNRLQSYLTFAFLLFMVLPVDLVAQGGSAPVILSVTVNYQSTPWQITIRGRNFKPSTSVPTILFNNEPVYVPQDCTDQLVVATLTSNPNPGTFLLTMTNSKKVTGTAYLTIGAEGPPGEGWDQPVKWEVLCSAGGSVNAALAEAGNRSSRTTFSITGFCNEDVNIERSNITIRAADGSPDAGFNKLNLNLGAHEIRIENLRIAHGLNATDGATFRAENLRVDQPDWGSVSLSNSASGLLINPTLTNCGCIEVQAGAYLHMNGGTLSGTSSNTAGGVSVSNGGSMDIIETVIQGLVPGLTVGTGGSVYLDHATIENGTGDAINARGSVILFGTVISTYILKLIVFLARYFAACSETSMESGLQPYF